MLEVAALLDCCLDYQEQAQQVEQQQQWIMQLAQILDAPAEESADEAPSGETVAQWMSSYLEELEQLTDLAPTPAKTRDRIIRLTRGGWWSGLFACYDHPLLPPTNNDTEQAIGRLKQDRRRTSGRKRERQYLRRYGPLVALDDPGDDAETLLLRFGQLSSEVFQAVRKRWEQQQEVWRKEYRFRHRRSEFLADLEARWAAAFG